MPLEWTGLAGKVADGFNDVIIANQALEAELARVSRVVGKQGELSQRVALGGSTRGWSGSNPGGPVRARGVWSGRAPPRHAGTTRLADGL